MSILDALIPPREQRVLSAVVLRPHESFSTNELIRISGHSRSTAGSIIDRFVKAKILLASQRGNQKRLQFNKSWPLAKELSEMLKKSCGFAEPIAEALASLREHIEIAFIFGSIAKGTDHAESDIDLMIVGDIPTIKVIEALNLLNDRFGRPINFDMHTPDEWRDLLRNDSIVQGIMSGPRIKVYERADESKSVESS